MRRNTSRPTTIDPQISTHPTMATRLAPLRRSMPSLLSPARTQRQTTAVCARPPRAAPSTRLALAGIPPASSPRRHLSTTTPFRARSPPNPSAPAPKRGVSKLYATADDAVADIQPGSTLLSSGFGLCGVAETLIAALARRGRENLHSLTAVSNNAGVEGKGGLAALTAAGMVDRLVLSYLGSNKGLERAYLSGAIAVELCPQGTLAERLRAAGAGVPAFFTPTGAHSLVQEGGIPVRLGPGGAVLEGGRKRETRVFGGRTYLLETALPGDVAILRAWKADAAGNCVFRYTTQTFGPAMAKAAALTIVEAENVVEVGEIDPMEVDLPGIYVDRIVPATAEKHLEVVKLREEKGGAGAGEKKSEAVLRRERIARRAAKELKDGYYVNLGVGIPTLAPSFLPEGQKVWLQSENGILGMGPYPTKEQVDPYVTPTLHTLTWMSEYQADLRAAMSSTPARKQSPSSRAPRPSTVASPSA